MMTFLAIVTGIIIAIVVFKNILLPVFLIFGIPVLVFTLIYLSFKIRIWWSENSYLDDEEDFSDFDEEEFRSSYVKENNNKKKKKKEDNEEDNEEEEDEE